MDWIGQQSKGCALGFDRLRPIRSTPDCQNRSPSPRAIDLRGLILGIIFVVNSTDALMEVLSIESRRQVYRGL
jgi:hypothetical protein